MIDDLRDNVLGPRLSFLFVGVVVVVLMLPHTTTTSPPSLHLNSTPTQPAQSIAFLDFQKGMDI